jgi:hypothetical protein
MAAAAFKVLRRRGRALTSTMRVRVLVLVVIAQLALGACAVGPERQVLRDAGSAVELVQVPFFPQDEYQCGPAALATVLVHSGVDVTPQQLVDRVYVPDRRGSLQAEMLAATRSQGRVPYVLPGSLAPILAELRAGQPVLLLQNLGLERWPVWHYAVLIGFDPAKEKFLLRSGITRREESSAVPFLASWDRGGRWSMVVVEAGEPPRQRRCARLAARGGALRVHREARRRRRGLHGGGDALAGGGHGVDRAGERALPAARPGCGRSGLPACARAVARVPDGVQQPGADTQGSRRRRTTILRRRECLR